jgi:hypothetical protein
LLRNCQCKICSRKVLSGMKLGTSDRLHLLHCALFYWWAVWRWVLWSCYHLYSYALGMSPVGLYHRHYILIPSGTDIACLNPINVGWRCHQHIRITPMFWFKHWSISHLRGHPFSPFYWFNIGMLVRGICDGYFSQQFRILIYLFYQFIFNYRVSSEFRMWSSKFYLRHLCLFSSVRLHVILTFKSAVIWDVNVFLK